MGSQGLRGGADSGLQGAQERALCIKEGFLEVMAFEMSLEGQMSFEQKNWGHERPWDTRAGPGSCEESGHHGVPCPTCLVHPLPPTRGQSVQEGEEAG